MTQVDSAIYAMGAIFAGPTADGTNGQVLVTNGSKQLSFTTIVSGVSALNSLTGSLSIAVGTSGSDVAVSASGSTVTVNIPDAGASARGVLTTGTQTIAGTKTFTGNTVLNPASGAPLTVQLNGTSKLLVGSDGESSVASLQVGTVAAHSGSVQHLDIAVSGGYCDFQTWNSTPIRFNISGGGGVEFGTQCTFIGSGTFTSVLATTAAPISSSTAGAISIGNTSGEATISSWGNSPLIVTTGGVERLRISNTGATTITATSGAPLTVQLPASHASAPIILNEVSSTSNRANFAIDVAWIDSTDATRKARATLSAYDTAVREFARGWGDGSVGRIAVAAPASAPTDAHLAASQISFYLDESGHNLIVRVKYANGTTLKTATIALV